jgi:hypothetical protein
MYSIWYTELHNFFKSESILWITVIKIYLEKEETKIIIIQDQIISLYYDTCTQEKTRKKYVKRCYFDASFSFMFIWLDLYWHLNGIIPSKHTRHTGQVMTYPYLHTHTHTHTHSINNNKKDWQECIGTVKCLKQTYQCHSLKFITVNWVWR